MKTEVSFVGRKAECCISLTLLKTYLEEISGICLDGTTVIRIGGSTIEYVRFADDVPPLAEDKKINEMLKDFSMQHITSLIKHPRYLYILLCCW